MKRRTQAAFLAALLLVLLVRVLPVWTLGASVEQDVGGPGAGGGGVLAAIDALGGFKIVMAAVVSIPILIASLVAIFRPSDPDAQKWAFGAVGTLLGFWLGQ